MEIISKPTVRIKKKKNTHCTRKIQAYFVIRNQCYFSARHLLYLQCKPDITFISELPHESQLKLFIKYRESSRNYFRSSGWLNAHTTGSFIPRHLHRDISIRGAEFRRPSRCWCSPAEHLSPRRQGMTSGSCLVPKVHKSSFSARGSAGGGIVRMTLKGYWELKSLFLLHYMGLIFFFFPAGIQVTDFRGLSLPIGESQNILNCIGVLLN